MPIGHKYIFKKNKKTTFPLLGHSDSEPTILSLSSFSPSCPIWREHQLIFGHGKNRN